MRFALSLSSFVIMALALSASVAAQMPDEQTTTSSVNEKGSSDFRGGALRVGAFAITGIDAELYFGPSDFPIAIPIDMKEDLGFRDSLIAFRSSFSYRFSKHHGISASYYQFTLDGTRILERTIDIGDREFQIGVNVESRYEEKSLKLAYDWIFHDEGKVALSVSPGMHVSTAKFTIGTITTLLPIPEQSENASVTAPLPLLGGRIQYRISDKWSFILYSDHFFLSTGDQEGALTDSSLLFEYQGSEHLGFGIGLNRFALDLTIVDDDLRWDWESVYTGAFLYATVRF